MAATTVKPLNGAEEYLRWKQSMLLVLHTVGVAHVLSDDTPPPPPPAPGVKEEDSEAAAAARRKWARDDAVCRGHILAALSDRIFPDYVRHGTGRAAWEAVARTYDDVGAPGLARRMFDDLEFYANPPLNAEALNAEALNAATRFPLGDEDLTETLCEMLPENVGKPALARSSGDNGGATMRDVWHVARFVETRRVCREDMERHGRCWKCGKPGHHNTNCMG